MSDVERTSNEGGNPGNSARSPARNMADIARLFLEGARPADGASTPSRRVPPKPAAPSASRRETPQPQPPVAKLRQRAATVLGIAAAPYESATWKLLVRAAQGLADEQATTVGVIGLLPNGGGTSFTIDVVGIESPEELPAMRVASEGSDIDMQMARAIHALRPAVGLWVIASPQTQTRVFPAVAGIVGDWLLACATDNDGLVAGYQLLKNAWSRCGKQGDIRPTTYLFCEDYAHAAMVHKRLRKATQEFLKTDLALAGAGPIRTSHEPIRVLNLTCHGPEDALWAAILDELCPMDDAEESLAQTDIEAALEHVERHADELSRNTAAPAAAAIDHLAQVLDPEERAALSAAFDEPGVPVATARTPVAPAAFDMTQHEAPPAVVLKSAVPQAKPPASNMPRPPRPPTPTTPSRPAPVPVENRAKTQEAASEAVPSLRAFDLEECRDREAQWQAIERSIWDLSPRSALLDAKPPMSWATETCISIDGDGCLNVWTLYKDGASWFALREWAHEHRNLLALTRRDLAVRKEADVAVHIVLPLEEDAEKTPAKTESVVSMLMRTPAKNLHVYRLRIVQWNGRQGMVVVPIA
jgi:hypothetical protein